MVNNLEKQKTKRFHFDSLVAIGNLGDGQTKRVSPICQGVKVWISTTALAPVIAGKLR
jgi:hypothetical protein